MKEQLASFLILEGFTPVSTNIDDFSIYLKKETGHVTVLMILSVKEGEMITESSYRKLRDDAVAMLKAKNLPELHSFFLILTSNVPMAVLASNGDRNAWIIDDKNAQLVIPPDRAEDFYGLKGQLQVFLKDPGRADELLTDVRKNLNRAVEAKKKADEVKMRAAIPWVTIGILVLNLLVGLLCLIFGEPLFDALDLDPTAIFERHQWYRIFTYMYVHAGITHYVNNMVMLYLQGNILEKPLGCVRFVILYHVLGILAGLGSLAYKVYTGSTIGSVGASGAIMGLMGMLFYISIRSIGTVKRGGLNRILLLLLCAGSSIYQGFVVPGVDNAAHIAGMLVGVLTGIIWELMMRRRREK